MPLLSDLPTYGPDGCLNVVIETPKGSRNKIAYDPEFGVFRFKAVMPEGSLFPYDFGFIPSTVGQDGDPLDILVLMDAAVPMGCLVEARPLGIIEAEQREADGTTERNDRLIAAATRARNHVDLHDLADLRSGLLDEIESFFVQYNALSGRRFKPVGRGGPDRAAELIRQAVTAYAAKAPK